jgi:hypothetical protein
MSGRLSLREAALLDSLRVGRRRRRRQDRLLRLLQDPVAHILERRRTHSWKGSQPLAPLELGHILVIECDVGRGWFGQPKISWTQIQEGIDHVLDGLLQLRREPDLNLAIEIPDRRRPDVTRRQGAEPRALGRDE